MSVSPSPARISRYGNRLAQLLVLAITAILTVGCAPKAEDNCLIKPTGVTGQQCLETCNHWRQQCQERQRTREKLCANQTTPHCQDTQDAACKDTANSMRCIEPLRCLGTDLTVCEQYHAQCTDACNRSATQQRTAQHWWQRLRHWERNAKPTPATPPTDSPFL